MSRCKVVRVLLMLQTGLVLAGVQEKGTILSQVDKRDEKGYHFWYSTSDGQDREETGSIEEENGKYVLRVRGIYSYFDGNKKLHVVPYTADENGYQPLIKANPPEHYSPNDHPKLVSDVGIPKVAPHVTKFEIPIPAAFPIVGLSGQAIASLTGGGIG